MTDTSTTDVAPPLRFVAFVDILGWSAKVLSDFGGTISLYRSLLDFCRPLADDFRGLESLRFASDSILIVSETVWPLLRAVNVLHHATLFHDCLLRGGIAFGKHVEAGKLSDLHIVSEPLVWAAHLEREVHHPCVALHESAVPEVDPRELLAADVFLRPILYFEGRWIVNPFNIMWGTSAVTRVTQLWEQYPEHAEKYKWFLRLYEAVRNRDALVPLGPPVAPPAA
jgi:hypothetical protein